MSLVPRTLCWDGHDRNFIFYVNLKIQNTGKTL